MASRLPKIKAPTIQHVDLGDPNDGLVNLTIGDVTILVDVYQANERIFGPQQRCADGELTEEQFIEEVVQIIARLGFPTVPHRTAVLFINRISALHGELQKKTLPAESTESPQKSPDSTSSIPTDGHSASSCDSTG